MIEISNVVVKLHIVVIYILANAITVPKTSEETFHGFPYFDRLHVYHNPVLGSINILSCLIAIKSEYLPN